MSLRDTRGNPFDTHRLIEGKYPMAATLLRRAMVEDTLNGAKSTQYKHAARHLLECAPFAPGIQDFVCFKKHESYRLPPCGMHFR